MDEVLTVNNLGYPVMSVTKDLWLHPILRITLPARSDYLASDPEISAYNKQLFPPLLQNNPAEVER